MQTQEELEKLRRQGLATPVAGLSQVDSLITTTSPQGMSEPITTPSVMGPTPGQEQVVTPPALSVTAPDLKTSVLPTMGISPSTSPINVLGETPGPVNTLTQPVVPIISEIVSDEEAAKVEESDLGDSDELSQPVVARIDEDNPDKPMDSGMDPQIILNQKPPKGSTFSTPFPSEDQKQPEISAQDVLPKTEPAPIEASPLANPIQEVVPVPMPKAEAPLSTASETATIPAQPISNPLDTLKSETVAQPITAEATIPTPAPEQPQAETFTVQPEGEHLPPIIPSAVEDHVKVTGETATDTLHKDLATAHPDHAEVTGPQVSAEGMDGGSIKINTGAWGPNALKAAVPGVKPDMSSILSIHDDRLAKKEAHAAGATPKIFEKFLSFFNRKKKDDSQPVPKAA